MMSSSSNTTTMPSTATGGSGARGAGSVTMRSSPVSTRSDLAPARPPTSTRPSPISSAARDRDRPNILATAASSRSPSSPSGTEISRTSLITAYHPGPVEADAAERQDRDQRTPAADGGVGQVEYRPDLRNHRDPVNH